MQNKMEGLDLKDSGNNDIMNMTNEGLEGMTKQMVIKMK